MEKSYLLNQCDSFINNPKYLDSFRNKLKAAKEKGDYDTIADLLEGRILRDQNINILNELQNLTAALNKTAQFQQREYRDDINYQREVEKALRELDPNHRAEPQPSRTIFVG